MKRVTLNYAISILLLLSIIFTALLGYVQSQLDLHKFIPHRYAAYITLCLAAAHVGLNASKLWRYLRRKR